MALLGDARKQGQCLLNRTVQAIEYAVTTKTGSADRWVSLLVGNTRHPGGRRVISLQFWRGQYLHARSFLISRDGLAEQTYTAPHEIVISERTYGLDAGRSNPCR